MERACFSCLHMLVTSLFGRDQTTGVGVGAGIGATGISTACEFASSAFEVPSDTEGLAIFNAARGNMEQVMVQMRDMLSNER